MKASGSAFSVHATFFGNLGCSNPALVVEGMACSEMSLGMYQVEVVEEAAKVQTSSAAEEGEACRYIESGAGTARSRHCVAAEVACGDVDYVKGVTGLVRRAAVAAGGIGDGPETTKALWSVRRGLGFENGVVQASEWRSMISSDSSSWCSGVSSSGFY